MKVTKLRLLEVQPFSLDVANLSYVRDRAWFVRLYGEIIPEL